MFSQSLQDRVVEEKAIPDPEPGRVLLACGSPRKGGNTETLLRAVEQGLQENGASTELVALADYDFGSCVGCEKCRKDKACTRLMDGMQLLYPKIIASQGLFLGSPVYNYNVTSWMKAFIDRLYCFYAFTRDRPRCWASRLARQGRKAGVLVVGEQDDPKDLGVALPSLAMAAEALGYGLEAKAGFTGHFNKGSAKKSADSLQTAADLGRTLARGLGEKP